MGRDFFYLRFIRMHKHSSLQRRVHSICRSERVVTCHNAKQKRASGQTKLLLVYAGTCLLFSKNKQPCYQADTH